MLRVHFNGKPPWGCILTILALNGTIGALCFDYALYGIIGKDVPWYADVVAGLFLGQFAVPITIIVWIVSLCGVAFPFIKP